MTSMDNAFFKTYFEKTIWRGADKVPSYEELKKMEDACLDKLLELKKQDYQQFRFLFVKYGMKVVERISFCDSKRYEEGIDEVMPLRSSYVRFLDNLKNLDRSMYEHSLRRAIDKGKLHKRYLESLTSGANKVDKHIEQKEEQAPHFVKLRIGEEKAAGLYDRLVGEKILEDTGKNDFIYYYTGKGKQASKKLRWLGDAILLSVLMQQLSLSFVPWKKMEQIYDGLNIKGMKAVLSKTKGYYSYEKHVKTVQEWLK